MTKQLKSKLNSKKLKHIKARLLGMQVCPRCKQLSRSVERRSLPTNYVDDERNFTTACYECYQDECEYYYELWEQVRGA